VGGRPAGDSFSPGAEAVGRLLGGSRKKTSPAGLPPTSAWQCGAGGRLLSHTQPQGPGVERERAGATLGAGSAGEGFERKKPEGGRPGWPAVSAEARMPSRKPPLEARPGPQGNRNTDAIAALLSGSPEAWPRGWHPPALAPRLHGSKAPKPQSPKAPKPQSPKAPMRRTQAIRLSAQAGQWASVTRSTLYDERPEGAIEGVAPVKPTEFQ
jgi:hypothetical protein